ncbi:MAG: NDP-sugar synthase, partial [Cyclobacteriaceae bacterium]
MKAMILAAGLGTRIQPLTKGLPKALAKVENKPLLELVIKKLIHFGYRQIIVNVHHQAEMIVDFLQRNKNFGIDIMISDESSQLLNTGGGIWNASWFFDSSKPFLIHNTDVLSNIDLNELLAYHKQYEAIATLCVRPREASRYLWFDRSMQLCGWENP